MSVQFTTTPRMSPFMLALLNDPGFIAQGAERGFNERADVMTQTVDGVDLNAMWDEIARTLAMYNDWRDTLLGRIMFRTDKVVETVGIPSLVDFEEASEYGQPVGIRGGAKRNRGYTFKFYDLAARFTWMYLAEATSEQIRGLANQAMEADNRLIFNRMLNCLFDPTNLVGVADSNIPVNVYKFYNADGEVPPAWKTTTHTGSHTHYLVSGNTQVTSANIDTLVDHLSHHGHDVNQGATLVLMVNKQEGAFIRAFRVATGAKYDFIPGANYGGGVLLAVNGGIIAKPQGQVPGEIGTYGPFHVVEEDYIPAGYVAALASGGPFNLQNPIGFREHVNPDYRGLKHIPGQRSTYPLVDSFYRRGFGVGVRQRGAGVIMQVKAALPYVIPSQYAAQG